MAEEIEELEKESAEQSEKAFQFEALNSRIDDIEEGVDDSLSSFEESLDDIQEEVEPMAVRVFSEELEHLLYPIETAQVGRSIKRRDRFNLSGVVNVSTTNTSVAGSEGATNLNSFTFFGNEWHVGMTVRVMARGVYTTDDATATVALALRMGSTTYNTITTTGATVTNAPWVIDWVFTVVTLGGSGSCETSAVARTNNVNKDIVGASTVAIDTTTNQALTIQATWSSGSAGDSITVSQFLVEILN